ncbi:hypothetical protein Ddye_006460 [Dipteronia dyeriana]|uniref:Uncharacterized protein n=1 Tax=Dipteronia dyeriana TaxID=168575 RepID=A0AAD9XIQ5_9ROSI|nr:hypothetical protein Ddye_006460 [Dipteronia dyeriana]
MVFSSNPVSGLKLSTVVPAKATGNKDHQLSNMDLALKLHYIKAVYFFDAKAAQGLFIYDLKVPMFQLLELYYTTSGRIRRSDDDGGRPFIKCNDGGVRIVEAFCDMTVDEWLAVKEDSRDDCLVYNHVLGPDLAFSPLVYVQFTCFKSGGMSLGLNWAHVLGDPFSATSFLNMWAQIISSHVPLSLPSISLHVPNPNNNNSKSSAKSSPVVKTLDPVGDLWRIPGDCRIESHTFHVTANQLDLIKSKIHNPITAVDFSDFEVLSALIWKSLLKIRDDSDLRAVTICNYDSGDRENEIPANAVVISTVEADFVPRKSEVSELAALISDKRTEANSQVEDMFEKYGSDTDVVVYGSNLTFVNMEGADVYGLKLRGENPVFVNYAIGGVGDEGVVLVLRGPEEDGCCGRTVTVVLPEKQLSELKIELEDGWGLV